MTESTINERAALATRPSWMEFDLAALRHNYRALRRAAGEDKKVIASLKANAYGHGAVEVARCLDALGVFALATGSFEEAVAIRRAGVALPILMFGGSLPTGVEALLAHRLTPTVCEMAMARAVSAAAAKNGPGSVPVYIKVDAGLGRLGVPLAEAFDFIEAVAALPGVVVEGVYTHLPFKDGDGAGQAQTRLSAFDGLLDGLGAAGIEVAVGQGLSSAGLLAGLECGANAVCPGHLLYGLSPCEPGFMDMSPYRPVLGAVKSRLIRIGELPRDGANRPARVGVIPFGRHQGCRRPAPGKRAEMLLAGRRVPVESVSLEHVTLDLSDIEDASIGDEVCVLGTSGDEAISVDDVAGWWGAVPLDVLMAFDGRLPSHYCG